MANTETGYKMESGEVVPFRTWRKVGNNFSIMPMKTTYRFRNDLTGEIVKPSGPASKDSLMMGLYLNQLPRGYAVFCFGGDAVKNESGPFLTGY